MSVQTNVNLYCKSKVSKAQAVVELTKALKRKSRETVRATLMPLVGKFWTVKLIDGEGKAKGTQVLDSSHKNYENAKRDLYDIVKAISSGSSGKKEAIEIPAELIAAAEKLAKLSKKYEQSRSLANKAVAEAFAQ